MSLHKFSIFYAEGFAMPGVQFPQLRRFGAPMWWGWSRWQLQSHSPYETQSLVCSQNVPVIHNIYIYSHVYIYICIHFIYIYTFIPYIHDGVWVFTMNGAPKRAFLSRMIFATRILGVTLELPGLSNQNALWKSLNRLMPCIQVATTFKMRNPFVVISTSAWFQVLCFIITRCYMIVIQIPIQSSGVIFFQKLKLESMNLRICIQKKSQKLSFRGGWNPCLAEKPEKSGPDPRGSLRRRMSQERLSTLQCEPPELRHRDGRQISQWEYWYTIWLWPT